MSEQATCGAGVQLSSGGGLSPEDDPDTIHIFSVASGHMYERLQKIMILSVTRNTRYGQQCYQVWSSKAPFTVISDIEFCHSQHQLWLLSAPGMVIQVMLYVTAGMVPPVTAACGCKHPDCMW